ncbi:MAG: SHOCT domain-containing protein [Deltaproteobacteria bacterium]
MKRATRALLAVPLACLGLLLACPTASGHMAGSTDHYGCHADRRKGGYHCHSGRMNGQNFRSKGAMLDVLESGGTADLGSGTPSPEESTDKGPAATKSGSGWKIGSLFGRSTTGAEKTASSGKLVPSGIERRLTTLKRLADQGLITDEEYTAKRKDILGEL